MKKGETKINLTLTLKEDPSYDPLRVALQRVFEELEKVNELKPRPAGSS